MRKNGLKKAFTLAEVLIVLGILGVVAAMTIPALVNKFQKNEYVIALKKFYSTQNNGWTHMLAEESVEKLEYTDAFQSINGEFCTIDDIKNADCAPFFNALSKYFKFNSVVAPSYTQYYLNGNKIEVFTGSQMLIFPDGTMMYDATFYHSNDTTAARLTQITNGGGHLYNRIGKFTVDVNGFKGPNVLGRDLFRFELSNDGRLYPFFGKDDSLYLAGDLSNYWRNASVICGTSGSSDVSSAMGVGCAARIMEEGWEMNY